MLGQVDRARARRAAPVQPGGRAGRGAARRAHRPCARCRRHRRCAGGVAALRPDGLSTIARTNNRSSGHMARRYFGTDGIRGTVGQSPITPDFLLRLGHAVGRVLRRSTAAAHGGDRQGHADLGLHDRVGARGGLRVGRCRHAAERSDSHAGCGLPHTRIAPRSGGGDQRVAQPVCRQRHQVLLGRRREAARRVGDARWKPRSASRRNGSTSRGLGKARRIDDAGGRYIEFCKSTVQHDLSLRGMKIVRRRGARRGVPRGTRRVPRARCRRGIDRRAPDGLNINDGVGATAPAAW